MYIAQGYTLWQSWNGKLSPTKIRHGQISKNIFVEAYETRFQSGTTGGNPYHGAANTFVYDDIDSIGTITQIMANMQHEENTNAETMSDNMLAMTSMLESMDSTIQAQQQ